MGKWEEETALILLLFPLLFFLWRTGDEGKSAFRLFSFLTSPFKKWRGSVITSFLLSHASSYYKKREKNGRKRGRKQHCFLSIILSPFPCSKRIRKRTWPFFSSFSRPTPFFRNGNGRENLFFLLSFFQKWREEIGTGIWKSFPLIPISPSY